VFETARFANATIHSISSSLCALESGNVPPSRAVNGLSNLVKTFEIFSLLSSEKRGSDFHSLIPHRGLDIRTFLKTRLGEE